MSREEVYVIINGDAVARFCASVRVDGEDRNIGYLKDGRKVIHRNSRWEYHPPGE